MMRSGLSSGNVAGHRKPHHSLFGLSDGRLQERSSRNGAATSFASFAELCVSRQMYSAIEASQRKKHLPLNSYVSLYEESVEEGKKVPLIDTIEPQEENNPEALYFGKEFTEIFSERLKENLSTLENHVLELHLMGTDYRKIAELLGKSPKAVDNALQRIIFIGFHVRVFQKTCTSFQENMYMFF